MHRWRLKKKCNSKKKKMSVSSVSLTSVPCKLLEHVMFRHIMTHLDAHNVLADHQHGSRSNRYVRHNLLTP